MIPKWLWRVLAGLAALLVAWFAAYWYFGLQYMDELKTRTRVSGLVAAAML